MNQSVKVAPVSAPAKAALRMLFASYDLPFGQTEEERKSLLQGFVWVIKGKPDEVVEMVVRDFIGGLVERTESARSKLPKPEEFAARVAFRLQASGAGEDQRKLAVAPFSALWSAKFYLHLLAGPDAVVPKPPRALAEMISRGGENARRLVLQRQAAHGFQKVSRMLDNAAFDRGCTAVAQIQPLAKKMESVATGNCVIEAWRTEHEERGWPWPSQIVERISVYLPAGGPNRLADFEGAARRMGFLSVPFKAVA